MGTIHIPKHKRKLKTERRGGHISPGWLSSLKASITMSLRTSLTLTFKFVCDLITGPSSKTETMTSCNLMQALHAPPPLHNTYSSSDGRKVVHRELYKDTNQLLGAQVFFCPCLLLLLSPQSWELTRYKVLHDILKFKTCLNPSSDSVSPKLGWVCISNMVTACFVKCFEATGAGFIHHFIKSAHSQRTLW